MKYIITISLLFLFGCTEYDMTCKNPIVTGIEVRSDYWIYEIKSATIPDSNFHRKTYIVDTPYKFRLGDTIFLNKK